MAVGWVFVAFFTFGNADEGGYTAMGSPFFGVGVLASTMEEQMTPSDRFDAAVASACIWSLIYLSVAVALYLATRATIDRCVGRMTDRPQPRPRHNTEPVAPAVPVS
jgi:hypothetical protein